MTAAEAWDSSHAYERYMGRWSRKVATEFLRWLAPGRDLEWADIGCGTGVLSSSILEMCEPSALDALDSSAVFVSQARRRVHDPRARFVIADAVHLPWESAVRDVTASGLVLNFVRDHEAMTREMTRVTRPGGRVAAYVWDYAGGMEMIRHFWDAAISVSPKDARLDQAERFPLCGPEPLRTLFEQAGLRDVMVRAIDIATVFEDFDDYWQPFLGRTGAAPTYLASLSDDVKERIRLHLKSRIAPPRGGPIALTARAWAVQGMVAVSGSSA